MSQVDTNTSEISVLQDTVSELFQKVETAHASEEAGAKLKVVTNNSEPTEEPYEATVIFQDEADFFLFSITKVASKVWGNMPNRVVEAAT